MTTVPPFPVGDGRHYVPEEVRALSLQIDSAGRSIGARLGRHGTTTVSVDQSADLLLEIAEKALTARRLMIQARLDQEQAAHEAAQAAAS